MKRAISLLLSAAAWVILGVAFFAVPASANPDCVALPSDAVAWWSGDGHSEDLVGTNHGTLNGNATYAQGKVGYAFSLDGSGDYVNIPHSTDFNTMTSAATIESWIKVSSFPHAHSTIVSKGDTSWRTQRFAGTNFSRFGSHHSGQFNDLDGDVNINDGNWHHVVGVFDGTTKHLYVDGNLDASVNPAGGNLDTNTFAVRIGDNSEQAGRYWHGLIDEVTLYDRALSEAEIDAIVAADSDGKCRTHSTLTPTRFDDPNPPDGCAALDCSLREALIAANGTPGDDTIDLPAGTYDLSISGAGEDAAATGDLDITEDVTITGDGATSTIIDANDIDRVFQVMSGVTVDVLDIAITNGTVTNDLGGGIRNAGALSLDRVSVSDNSAASSGVGGGIKTFGTLTLIDSSVTDNTAGTSGGIATENATVSITSSTVSGNTIAAGGAGLSGGITVEGGSLTLTNSTVSGNTVTSNVGLAHAGGIYYRQSAPTFTNSTIANNTGRGVFREVVDGGLAAVSANTIIADNSAANCNVVLSSAGGMNNLDDDSTCFSGAQDIHTDPQLGALAYNGGPTKIHALGAGSPAIDAGTNTGCPATDQRGVARPIDGPDGNATATCDIGAFEFAPIQVTRADDPGPDGCVPSDCSLREAVLLANNSPGADTFGLGTFTYNLTIAGTGENASATGDLDVTANGPLTITGNGAANTFIQACDVGASPACTGIDRIFDVQDGATLTLSGATLRNGDGPSEPFDRSGGAIRVGVHLPWEGGYAGSSSLTLSDSTLANNTASGHGGAISSIGTVNISNSVISGNNSAGFSGGGVLNNLGGTLTVSNSTFSTNTAGSGGAILANPGALNAPVTINNSTISGNVSSSAGGGLYQNSGAGGSSPFTVTNSTVSGNLAATGGGGIIAGGSGTVLTNVTVTGNTADSDGTNDGDGGGLQGTATIKNSILAGNSDLSSGGSPVVRPDCDGTITSDGNNLIGDGTGCAGPVNGTGGDQVGTGATPIDPLLGPLADNGGPTKTHALLQGSPAIDKGTDTGAPDLDQRGLDRPVDGDGNPTPITDIGAYEANALTIDDVAVTEGGNAVFTIGLATQDPGTVTVSFATQDDSAQQPGDYANTSGSRTFNPGDLTKTVSVPTVGDSNVEPDETFFVNLSNSTNATLADAQGQGTILNDDSAPPGGGGGPPSDSDGDGIPDSTDACDNEAEDVDGFEDTDGCPEPDNDQDTIPDVDDACPNEAEDADGFEDDDGCPEDGTAPPAPQPTVPECQANPALNCGTNSDDNITIDGSGQTWFLGGGNDTVVVTGCDNTIYLQDGNDTVLLLADCGNLILLGTGDDQANVGQSPARTSGATSVTANDIRGEAGNDVLRGGARADALRGGSGVDVLTGRGGNDYLRGDAGRDKLRGGAGDDVLSGGSGTDACVGGPGQNKYRSCEH